MVKLLSRQEMQNTISIIDDSPFTDQIGSDDLRQLATYVADRYISEPLRRATKLESNDLMSFHTPGVYIALRSDGIKKASIWTEGGTVGDMIAEGVTDARHSLPPETAKNIDTIELCLTHSYKNVDPAADPNIFLYNLNRGIVGLEIQRSGNLIRYSPNEMIARNLSLSSALDLVINQHILTIEQLLSLTKIRVFDCLQILVYLHPVPKAINMVRGNQIVTMDEVTADNVQNLSDGLADWLVGQVNEDGRLTYKYWPSRGEESSNTNMIRQWMASLALVRIAQDRNAPTLVDLVGKNIQYNLDHYFRSENGLGLIEWNGRVKLGAVALAALTLTEYPRQEQYEYARNQLLRTVDFLWNEDGSFCSFYEPSGRCNVNQNFYPGEALLLWSFLYQQTKNPELLYKIMKSFEYYRQWHLENRNPAFVPWHTQAYYNLWQITPDEDLEQFIFQMNDWLLEMQQGESNQFPDTMGRFYDPTRQHFGPPHASSTAVYVEGLIDAYRLAEEVGDYDRAQKYRAAILRGTRSLMQLQYTDDIDMYYINQRDRVQGGLRTTVYDNTIRVDNVQHAYMAVRKIPSLFSEDDYQQ